MDLLLLLVERRPGLVTREEIIARLWDHDVFVDVETGINTAIRKIRRALNDSRRQAAARCTHRDGVRQGIPFRRRYVLVPDADPPIMLAVLPFVNLTGDAEREYLADGLTEDAIAALSQIDSAHLRVIGRTSAMAYKGSAKSLATIGSELNAQFIVEGSLRTDGPVLRIRCTLNRVADQAQVWSASYDRDIAGLASVAHDLAAPLARQINPQLSREQVPSASRRQSGDAAAYDAYLRGRRFWNQLTAATTRKAVEYYTRATEIDPGYALAWAGIAEAFAVRPHQRRCRAARDVAAGTRRRAAGDRGEPASFRSAGGVRASQLVLRMGLAKRRRSASAGNHARSEQRLVAQHAGSCSSAFAISA